MTRSASVSPRCGRGRRTRPGARRAASTWLRQPLRSKSSSRRSHSASRSGPTRPREPCRGRPRPRPSGSAMNSAAPPVADDLGRERRVVLGRLGRGELDAALALGGLPASGRSLAAGARDQKSAALRRDAGHDQVDDHDGDQDQRARARGRAARSGTGAGRGCRWRSPAAAAAATAASATATAEAGGAAAAGRRARPARATSAIGRARRARARVEASAPALCHVGRSLMRSPPSGQRADAGLAPAARAGRRGSCSARAGRPRRARSRARTPAVSSALNSSGCQ